ncbi:MAG: hypothetical protein LAO21_05925 [Acidobacteriia bacterium]|nr:hypothetical protein [Terriglobia bacterium]
MRRYFTVLCLTPSVILYSGSLSGAAMNQKDSRPFEGKDAEKEFKQQRREAFSAARQLLLKENLPFDPDELLDSNWREKLAPFFERMPEMKLYRYERDRLEGVYLADTLVLPERIALSSDTVILVRKLRFEGSEVVIKGNFSIAIFPIESSDASQDSTRKFSHGTDSALPVLASAGLLKNNRSVALTPNSLKQHITIDTSGIGYSDWMKPRRPEGTRILPIALNALDQDYNGEDRSYWVGEPGRPGLTGPLASPNPAPRGPNGQCGGNIDGRNGDNGAFGNNGGDGDVGGQGPTGGNGQAIIVEITQNGNYIFSTHGGQGGKGGTGGRGGTGSQGATGGRGGDGAFCGCNPPVGNGGDGGKGGTGGDAGFGGKGGTGGTGGNGGAISITKPANFTGVISYDISAGLAGLRGDGGVGGDPGPAGTGGEAGKGGHLDNCQYNGRDGMPRGDGAWGAIRGFGDPGDPRQQGQVGSYREIISQSGYEGYASPSLCEIDVPPSCSDGIDNDGDGLLDANDPGCICMCPLVIDTLGHGFTLSSVANGVLFDMTGRGLPVQIAWIENDDAWVVLDRNHNGTIDDGTELFGNFTPQSPTQHPNGFRALAEYDKREKGAMMTRRSTPTMRSLRNSACGRM